MAMLQFQGVSYQIGAKDITYRFAVRIGSQEWFVEKVYQDFVALNTLLTAKYGSAALPRLTGVIYIRPLSDASGTKRLPKLEDFVTEILTTWKQKFKNPRYGELPMGKKKPPLLIEETIAEFLEVLDNYEIEEEDESQADAAKSSSKFQNDDDDGKDEKTLNTENSNEGDEKKALQQGGGAAATASKPAGHKRNPSSVVSVSPGVSPPASARQRSQTEQAQEKALAAVRNSNNNAAAAAAGKRQPSIPGRGAGGGRNNNHNDDDDGFEVIDAETDTFDSMHVLSQCRNMSSEVDVVVKDYVIHPKDYIAYNFKITFCGFSWIVTKRFSEFLPFHERLMSHLQGTEYADQVPPIDGVLFPAWRKCDPDVAEARSTFLTVYFKMIAPMMDEWFDVGFLTHFRIRRRQEEQLDTLERYASAANFIKVAVHRFLFDFFEFSDKIEEFHAESAEKVAKENERLLPQFMQKNLELVRKEEQRMQKEKNLAYRRSFMEQLTPDEFNDLLRIVSRFDDDRHALGLLEYFVKNGYYYPGKSRIERVQELDAQQAMLVASTARKRAATLQYNEAATMSPTASSIGMMPSTTSGMAGNFSNSNNGAAADGLLLDNNADNNGNAGDMPLDIFDQMAGSALFGTVTNTTDFTQLVTSAVNAAKEQLRGRANTRIDGQIPTANIGNAANSNVLPSALAAGVLPIGASPRRHAPLPGGRVMYDKVKLARPCGITSQQMAKIAAAIPFNDTRALAIAVMTPLLLEDEHMDEVFQTLIYDWEVAEKTVHELLTKKEAPENFKAVEKTESVSGWDDNGTLM